MYKKCFVFLLLISFWSRGQEHAWVYFTDKEDVEASIGNPISILSQRAITKKARYNIPIDERDVPVNESYIAQIKLVPNILVLAKSKWKNCIHVIGSSNDILQLESLSFVSHVLYADQSLNSKKPIDKFERNNHANKLVASQVDYNYGATVNQVSQITVDALHKQDYTGEGMLVAVMDSGFPQVNNLEGFSRLRNQGKLLGGYDFPNRTDDVFAYQGNDHGTKVLSTMAGFIEDSFVGTAPDASYVLFRTEVAESETPVEESYWVEAAERADSLGVDVINTSLGYSTFDEVKYNYTPSDMDGETTFISQGANIATEKGLLVVNSAGNSGASVWGIITAPADANVFTVGAVNAQGQYVAFSSRGYTADGVVKPDGMAMGRNSAVINTNNNVDQNDGTSFSSPIMAGAITSLWQAFPEKTNVEIMQMVRESASFFTNPNEQMGYGIPDFSSLIDDGFSDANQEDIKMLIYPNPSSSTIMLQLPENLEQAEVSIYDIQGKFISKSNITPSSNVISIAHLSSAVYILEVKGNDFNEKIKLLKY